MIDSSVGWTELPDCHLSITEEARQDVFDYIEMFYNPKRRHSFNNGLSPVECEKQYFERLESV
uniref:IS3 family transposase n=1 Tax=Aeromonas sp. HMWF016 TaxID=2056852 RepID=UPI002159F567|nr:IS3 family transposase [Aeromonas sp. HMWF016]